MTLDRLGSIGKYFPYGQERPSATTDGKEKFATYFRDSETGLDYADQRYHQPGMGRFMSPDRYQASAGPGDPGSWNRYAYTRGDPVNRMDPGGTCDGPPDTNTSMTVCADSGVDGDPTLPLFGSDIPSTFWDANCTEFGTDCPTQPAPPVDPNCERADWLGGQRLVYSTIVGDLAHLGIQVSGFSFDVQMAGGHNPGRPGRPADITELVLTTTNVNVFNEFVSTICDTAGNPYCFTAAGWDPFHSGMNYRQNVADNSMQITGGWDARSNSYVINIDIDPHNPSFGSLGGRAAHVGNVFLNGFTGGDTNYNKVAAALSANGIVGECP